MNIKIILTLLFLGVLSCKEKSKTINIPEKEEKVTTMNQITTDYDTLANRVKNKGMVEAYDELFYSFMDANEAERTDTLMIYSKIMAEKYNYKKAYFDYFKALCEKYDINVDYNDYKNINVSKLKGSQKKQAEEWLNKMLEKKIITQSEFNSIKK